MEERKKLMDPRVDQVRYDEHSPAGGAGEETETNAKNAGRAFGTLGDEAYLAGLSKGPEEGFLLRDEQASYGTAPVPETPVENLRGFNVDHVSVPSSDSDGGSVDSESGAPGLLQRALSLFKIRMSDYPEEEKSGDKGGAAQARNYGTGKKIK